MIARCGARSATRLVIESGRVAHAESVRGIPRTPFGVRSLAKNNQGLRSFHSLNPWLSSLHPFGVTAVAPNFPGARLKFNSILTRECIWSIPFFSMPDWF